MNEPMPETPTERGAVVVRLLCVEGRAMTTKEIALALGVSVRHTYRVLGSVSRVVGICVVDGRWRGFRNGRDGE